MPVQALTANSAEFINLEQAVAGKADDELTNERISTVNALASEAKNIALKCHKEDVINSFKDWTTWFRRGLFAAATLVVVAAGTWYAQQLTSERALDEVKASVAEQQRSTSEIQKSVQEIKEAQVTFKKEQTDYRNEINNNLSKLIVETINTALQNNKKSKRRKRNRSITPGGTP